MPKRDLSLVKLAIAIPTYNEASNIPNLISKIKSVTDKYKIDCTLLIIDDDSPDETWKVAQQLKKQLRSKSFRINVLHRKQKDGLGKAYIDGFNKLLKENFTHVIQMDADLSHDPKYLPDFIRATESANFVVGSRYIKGGSTPDWAWNRKLLSHGGNLYARLILGSKISDYTGGYNLYSAGLLKSINLSSTIKSGGYGFMIELKYNALKKAPNVVQIPIIFHDRVYGISKIPKSTLVNNLILVPRLKLKQILPAKVKAK